MNKEPVEFPHVLLPLRRRRYAIRQGSRRGDALGDNAGKVPAIIGQPLRLQDDVSREVVVQDAAPDA